MQGTSHSCSCHSDLHSKAYTVINPKKLFFAQGVGVEFRKGRGRGRLKRRGGEREEGGAREGEGGRLPFKTYNLSKKENKQN